MKIKIHKRGCRSILWRAFLVPIVLGLLIGFAAVAAALRLGQQVAIAESVPSSSPTSAPPASTRVVILLVGAGEDIVGVWQWWSDPTEDTGKAACILSPETRIAPSGRTVAELMNLAMAAGDDAWVAKNTRDFASDCLLGQTSSADEVIFVSESGMIELVEALGGIQADMRQLDGLLAWSYLVSPGAAPNEVQRRQQAVWTALRIAAKRAPRPACDRIADAQELFRSVPDRENPCHQLETLLVQTPSYIATP
jgi:hypothetical protein